MHSVHGVRLLLLLLPLTCGTCALAADPVRCKRMLSTGRGAGADGALRQWQDEPAQHCGGARAEVSLPGMQLAGAA